MERITYTIASDYASSFLSMDNFLVLYNNYQGQAHFEVLHYRLSRLKKIYTKLNVFSLLNHYS